MSKFPPFAPFPRASWRQHLAPQDWNSLLEAWLTLCQASLSLSDDQLRANIKADDSVILFLDSFMEETAEDGLDSLGSYSALFLRVIFQLTSRLLAVSASTTDARLFEFPFLSNFARVYSKKLAAPVFTSLFSKHGTVAEASLTSLKKLLIPHLESGIKGDLKLVHSKLTRLNYLLHASPDACALLLAGSDFFDGLVTCFRVMNPPLRKTIITTVYVCLIGLTENEPPKWSMLGDQLYVLKSAADSHKQGPLNVNDSLVPELVTCTPVLKVLLRRAESSGSATQLLKNRITALMEFKKGPMIRPKGHGRRKLDKGKGKQTQEDTQAEIHVHKMSQITQIQDLFPDLGAGFIAKCLDEYNEDVELVVANLLSESLPPHLATADRSEPLYVYEIFIFPIQCPYIYIANKPVDHHKRHVPSTLGFPPSRQCHHNSRLGKMSLTTTILIVSLQIHLKYHLERSQEKPPMRFSLTVRALLVKQPSFLRSQRWIRMMMSVTTLTTPMMLAALLTPQIRRLILAMIKMKRFFSVLGSWMRRYLTEMPRLVEATHVPS
jgi:activating signal cointegrator complex subunit 2